MKKIIKFSVFLTQLVSLPTAAQNIATTSGNWNDCATWGYPSGITKGNDLASTKNINSGVSVVMNTNWNVQSVTLGTGSQLDFASSANGLDLNIGGGIPQICLPHFALGSATTTTTITQGSTISFSNIANSGVTISGANVNLLAGHLYKLTSAIYMGGTSDLNKHFDYRWVTSSNVRIGSTGRAIFQDQNYPDAMITGAIAYYQPVVNETVRVMFTSVDGVGNYVAGRTFALVEEIPTTLQSIFTLEGGTSPPVTNNMDVVFNGSVVSNGIAHTVGTANFTLTAGKTYKLTGSLWVSGVFTDGTIAWVDTSNTPLPGQVDRAVNNAAL